MRLASKHVIEHLQVSGGVKIADENADENERLDLNLVLCSYRILTNGSYCLAYEQFVPSVLDSPAVPEFRTVFTITGRMT